MRSWMTPRLADVYREGVFDISHDSGNDGKQPASIDGGTSAADWMSFSYSVSMRKLRTRKVDM